MEQVIKSSEIFPRGIVISADGISLLGELSIPAGANGIVLPKEAEKAANRTVERVIEFYG